MIERSGQYRIACSSCDDDSMDGVESLEVAIAAGWQVSEAGRVQTYEQSIQPSPPAASVLDWMTHYGQCPECAAVSD